MSPYMGYLPLLSVPLDKGNAFSRLIARLAPNTQLTVGLNRGLFKSCSSWYCPYFVTVRRYEKQINRRQPRFSSFSPISDVTCQVCQGSSISRSVPSHLRSVHTRRQVAETRRDDRSLPCTGLATSCSNMLRRHIAATNRFVYPGEML